MAGGTSGVLERMLSLEEGGWGGDRITIFTCLAGNWVCPSVHWWRFPVQSLQGAARDVSSSRPGGGGERGRRRKRSLPPLREAEPGRRPGGRGRWAPVPLEPRASQRTRRACLGAGGGAGGGGGPGRPKEPRRQQQQQRRWGRLLLPLRPRPLSPPARTRNSCLEVAPEPQQAGGPGMRGSGGGGEAADGGRGEDLGMESTSLDDVLYRYASFRNLVDPITHDLIISLARYVHCPRPEGDSLGALEKLCRQLTYHLSPHSQWRRQGSLVKKKPQACLKALLVGNPQDQTVDLSGIPLTLKDLDRVITYLQHSAAAIESVELCFTELTDELFLQLLPVLGGLPRLSTLSLNGNRLTKAILRDLTEALKDPRNFPSITWIDLGNNVDIFSLPQPFLVSLKKRCPTQGNLPTILEFGEGQASDPEGQEDPPAGGQEEGCHCGLGGHQPGGALEVSLVPAPPGAGKEEMEASRRLPLT